ncbi:MAG: DUF4252 domain-containing protein [Cyclobacteriaceae bacterium]
MRKLVLVIGMIVAVASAQAQGEIVSKYFDQFANNEEFVKVSISSKMFSLFTELEAGSDEEKEFLEAVSNLKGMKLVVGDSVANSAALYKQALSEVSKAGFDELMTVMDAEENFQFSIKEKGGIIEELIMVAGGKKSFVVLSLYGIIDLKNISKIARSMDVGGLDKLQQLDNSQKSGN